MTISVDWQADRGESACRIEFEGMEWFADIDQTAGGAGKHPSPHELLDSALGACTALTIQLYAKRKGYPLTGVQVEVDREVAAGVYRLRSRIHLQGELDATIREDLLRVAHKCPIHKALSGQFVIDSELV
ncbi:MAG: OsmC-like protein [Proteobacteria bacterium]|nr:OsmC-like protein [Pseudomonadota bacterium]